MPAMKKMLLAAVLLAVAAANTFAKDRPEAVLRSLPAQYKAFNAEEPFLYQDKRLGASIGYNDEAGIAITVYLYDLGRGDIEDGTGSAVVREAKEAAVADIRQAEKMGYYRNVKVVSDADATFGLINGQSLRMLSAQLTYEFTDELSGITQQVASAVYLTGMQGYICKIRVSRPAVLDKDREDGIQDILVALLTALKDFVGSAVQSGS